MDANSSTTRWSGLLLNPLDVLLFRDGRAFGATNRVLSGTLFPQTIAGALRTALLAETGFDFRKLRGYQGDIVDRLRQSGANEDVLTASFRGPWLAKSMSKDGQDFAPLFPCPTNLKTAKDAKDRWIVSRPVTPEEGSVAGWNHPDGLFPLRYAPDQVPDSKFESKLLTLSGLKKFLVANRPLDFGYEDVCDPTELTKPDHRVGIGIDMNRLTTVDGELYGIGFMSLRSDVRLYVEIKTTDRIAKLLDGMPITIGGEGKYTHVQSTTCCAFSTYDSTRNKSLWYLATPTFLSGRSMPNRPLPSDLGGKVRAAASGTGQSVSGWDVSRGGPRKARFVVPAGAVYYLDGPGKEDGFLEDPDSTVRLQEGWGFAIQGNWS